MAPETTARVRAFLWHTLQIVACVTRGDVQEVGLWVSRVGGS